MDWDEFQVEDKVDSRWFALVFTVVVLAAVGFYLHHSLGNFHALSAAAREGVVAMRTGT